MLTQGEKIFFAVTLIFVLIVVSLTIYFSVDSGIFDTDTPKWVLPVVFALVIIFIIFIIVYAVRVKQRRAISL